MAVIKTLNLNHLGSNSEGNFVNLVKDSLTETGFFLLENHGIPAKLLKENNKLFNLFFEELSFQQKMRYAIPSSFYQQGYAPLGVETGEYAKVADNKEYFQYGDVRPMLQIDEIPKLKELSEELFFQFNSLYKVLMGVIAVTLDMDRSYFDEELGNSIIRKIYYPAQLNPTIQNEDVEVVRGGNVVGMCASRHTDINDVTLLHATEPGLQLFHNQKWLPVLCNFDTIIINSGDMLNHLTGGRYKSGLHRVVCQPNTKRTASPFFGHRNDGASVVPLTHLGESDLVQFPFQTEGQYLDYRIKQIMGTL